LHSSMVSLRCMGIDPWSILWLRLGAFVLAGLPGGEETNMKKTILYIRLVREVALTVFVLIRLGKVVLELVGPALNYRRLIGAI
jgi:hypothetical protein